MNFKTTSRLLILKNAHVSLKNSSMCVDSKPVSIHTCKKGFVYDLADCLKPLMLEQSLRHKNSDVEIFWTEYKRHRLNRLIPHLIDLLLLGVRLNRRFFKDF